MDPLPPTADAPLYHRIVGLALNRLSETERDQLEAIVRLVRDVLGGAAVGTYLFGSAVDSGLRPDSDLDVLVVSSRRTTDVERRTMIDRIVAISRSRGDQTGKRHLEVTVVARSDIRPWRYPPRMDMQYGDWWRREFEAGEYAPWKSPNPDLAVLLTAARANGLPLFGPAIEDLVEPVPRADLDRSMREVLPDLIADLEDDVRNVLLTLARVWLTLETGAITSKDVAADWAAARLPSDQGGALRRARAGYLGEADDTWGDASMAAARRDAAAILEAIQAMRDVRT
jgi:predicted nucleotidyltransferase